MPHSNVLTSKTQAKLYITTTKPSSLSSWAGVEAIQGGSLANQIKFLESIDPITNEGNLIEKTFYGEATSQSIAGVSSRGSFGFTFSLQHSDTIHAAALTRATGTTVYLAYVVSPDADSNETAIILTCSWGGVTIQPAEDDVEKAVVTLGIVSQSDPIAES